MSFQPIGAPALGKPADMSHIGIMIKTPEKPSPDAVDPTDAATTAPEATIPDSAKPDSGATEPDAKDAPREIGGRGGPDPTRYGDWEKAGRCVDF